MRARTSVLAVLVYVLTGLVAAQGAAAAPVSVGGSGWAWSDPLPQGETLNRVVFAGARGYAVGAKGTVLRSDDGGGSWLGLGSGTGADLQLVQEVEPNVVVVGGGCSLRMSTDAGATFHRLAVNESESSCASKLTSFSFLSPTVGFFEQSDGGVLETTDGGQTFVPRTSVPLAGAAAGRIAFVSPTVGVAITSSGAVFRTADGAGSWTQVAAAPSGLTDVTFVTPTLAYAVGNASTVLVSNDAGETWSPQPLTIAGAGGPVNLLQVACSDATHCLMSTTGAGVASSTLVRTSDGGLTGSLVTPSEVGLSSVAFTSGGGAVAVGVGGATVLSSDGGASFPRKLTRRLGVHQNGPLRVGQAPLDAYAAGVAGQVLATTNGGESWSVLRVPTSSNLLDVAFPTPSTGYAVSEAGTVYRSPSGGLSWSILNGSGGSAPAALLAPNASTVLLVGPAGIRRSADSGASFSTVDQRLVVGRRHGRPLRKTISSLALEGAQQNGGVSLAYGSQLIESSDAGASWKLIPRPLAGHGIEGASFASASSGYATSAGRLFFTADAGRHWKEVRSLGAYLNGSLAFSSTREGYVLAPIGCESCTTVLHTADGGRSWTPEPLPRAIDALADAGGVAYASSVEAGAMFATRDGGLSPSASSLSLSLVGASTLSRSKLLHKQHGLVRLTGRLAPAQGGETVELAYRTGSGAWRRATATVSSNGAFAFAVSGIGASTDFVARWQGEGPVGGAGTAVTRLTVKAAKKRGRK
jgi:photosystem II stability/assembly factor-like uncharacterized protein